MKSNSKDIFVLEGEWEAGTPNKTTVESALQFLYDVNGIEYYHRRVVNKESFFYYLKKRDTKDSL